jgi:acetamidase/formamidase
MNTQVTGDQQIRAWDGRLSVRSKEESVIRHELHPVPGSVVDVFDRDTPAALTVDPGDTVVVGSLDASGLLERQRTPGETRPRMFPTKRGHCLTGPVAVRGASPGNVLAIHLVSLRPDDWGWTVAAAKDNALMRRLGLAGGPPAWLLWDIDADAGTATNDRGHTVRIAPFLGVIGVPPDEPGPHSTVPPRTVGGGNIDCRELTAGSTLYLPVTVPGALLHLGDGHAAQGDGEVSGTAIECPMTTEVVLDVLAEAPVPGVHAVTPAGRITFGFHEDLNTAMADALDAMLVWLQSLYGLDKATALALASPVVDLRVTQVANEAWGVHAVLPNDAVC